MVNTLRYMQAARNTLKAWRFLLGGADRSLCRHFQQMLAEKSADDVAVMLRMRNSLVANFGTDTH